MLMIFFFPGMFDSSNGFEHSSAGNSQSKDSDRKPQKNDGKDFSSGVVGVGVNNRTNDELYNDYADEEDVSIQIYSCVPCYK